MPRVLPAAARFLALALAWLACRDVAGEAEAQLRAVLTAEEKAAGWQLLFDGQSLAGWRGFKASTPPASWRAIDGTLARVAEGGDLMTAAQYDDFELVFDWKISAGGNSGVFFHVAADDEAIWTTGPEMQVLDNKGHRDGKDPITSAGSNFAVHAPRRDVTRPVGEWNSARLVVKRPHVEHWLNGEKVLEYELWSADWEQRVKASKFAKYPRYGKAKPGHIALQDHGDSVWYRNLKIRPL